MDKKTAQDWAKFADPFAIKKDLIDAALFLAYFEILNNTIIDRIASFFNTDYVGGEFVTSKKYKELILARKIKGKQNVFLASCQWLLENNVINSTDYEKIIEIKEERNKIAHNLPKYLFDSDFIIKKDLFSSIKDLTLKIEKWWIIEVELPCNSDFDGVEIDPDGIIPGQDLILHYIFNIANSDLSELKNMPKI